MHRKLHSSHMNKRISSKFCAIIIINDVSNLFSCSYSFWFRKIKSLVFPIFQNSVSWHRFTELFVTNYINISWHQNIYYLLCYIYEKYIKTFIFSNISLTFHALWKYFKLFIALESVPVCQLKLLWYDYGY